MREFHFIYKKAAQFILKCILCQTVVWKMIAIIALLRVSAGDQGLVPVCLGVSDKRGS